MTSLNGDGATAEGTRGEGAADATRGTTAGVDAAGATAGEGAPRRPTVPGGEAGGSPCTGGPAAPGGGPSADPPSLGAGPGTDPVPTVWQAMARGPKAFLLSSWPWRALGYLLSGGLLGVAWLLLAVPLFGFGLFFLPVGAGLILLLCVPLSAVGLAALERRRLRWLDPRPAPGPSRAAPAGAGRGRAAWARAKAPATWLEFGFALLNAVLAAVDLAAVALALGLVVSQPFALWAVLTGDQIMYGEELVLTRPEQVLPWLLLTPLFAVFAGYLLAGLAGTRAALARAVLVRTRREDELDARLVEVTASRARLADAYETERRRIERDLHDGAQQRLTGLIMTLGLAKLDADPALVAKAQDEARAVLAEIRDLIHGIHPSVLTDRGLGDAVESLAERAPVPVEVSVDLPVRPREAVEAAAYFAVAEALTNVARHSAATRAAVTVALRRTGRSGGAPPHLLVVEIRDNGRGGADPAAGTGLTGLADRVAVHNGTLRLSSPAGGPTVLRVELPCG